MNNDIKKNFNKSNECKNDKKCENKGEWKKDNFKKEGSSSSNHERKPSEHSKTEHDGLDKEHE